MRGTTTALIALVAWLPVCVGLFLIFSPRRAVLTAFIAGWMFLPMKAGFQLTGFPDIDKTTMTTCSVLLGVLLFDHSRLLSFKPRWFDLPVAIWCFSALITSVLNDLGIYDGISESLSQVFRWGLPYFIGRVYFNNAEAFRDLAMGIFIGGLVYVPLCLYEIRFSPQLHRLIYGYHQHSFVQTMRFGGFRPMVFMQHGLMVGMWMMAASLMGVWLWLTGVVKRLWGLPIWVLVSVLLITAVLCKSIGALLLLMMGLGTLYFVRYYRSGLLVLPLVLISPMYIGLRLSGLSTGQTAVDVVEVLINRERAKSLAFRLENEDRLTARALERPFFGWGGWRRSRVFDSRGNDITTTDGYWVIAVGQKGIIGLSGLCLTILTPAILFFRRFRSRYWSHPMLASLSAMAVLLCLYMIDCLMNAMLNPVFILGAGGLSGAAGFIRMRTAVKGPVQQAAVVTAT